MAADDDRRRRIQEVAALLFGTSARAGALTVVRPLLVANFAEIVGGGEISLLELADGLLASGHRPLLAIPGRGRLGAALDRGIDRVLFPRSILGMTAAFQHVAREIDLIHVTGARGLVAAGIARTGKKLVWHARVAARDKLDPVLERIPDLIIANSRATAARFGFDRQVNVIPNGVRRPVRAELPLPLTAGLRHIAVVARMTPEKGLDDLLPVIAELLESRPDCEVVSIGDARGLIGDTWRDLATRNPRLRLLGPVDRAADHFYEFDLVVIPSRVEGFGRVAAEALMAGVPVLARRVGGLIETLADAPDSFLPDDIALWKERILRALDTPPSAESLMRAGSAFTVEQHVDGVIRAYEALLD